MVRRPQLTFDLYSSYLAVVSLLGIGLVAAGVLQFRAFDPQLNFLLLLLLGAVSEIAATSAPVSDKAGITYHTGTAVSMAAVPFFGPLAGAVVIALSNIALWLIKPADETTWKKSWRQLAFNVGMHSLAVAVAGTALILLRDWLGEETVAGAMLPWLAAGFISVLVNALLLIGILRLQHGPGIKPINLWRENLWALSIDVVVTSVGGGLLAYAVRRYDSTGIIIFFLPILLSAYAFRLYVRQMQAHMNRLEEIVAERTRQISDLYGEKDAFLAVLAHDMKQPLTSVIAYADLLRKFPHLPEEKRVQMAEVIVRSGKVLREIVDNLVDIESFRSEVEPKLELRNFDLAALVATAVDSIEMQAQEKSIHLERALPEDGLPVEADEQKIQRVVVNLLSNAVKYTPANGTVLVTVDRSGSQALIIVQDTGYGIPADELPHIFDRFRRVEKHKDKAGGTGLGLAIVKSLVAVHKGQVLVESEEGVGSTFTVKLPLSPT
jgi:signal transduction histidine kinase